MAETNEFEFKAEMKQLLNLIVHSLYTHPEIFLRELVSNSSDALNKIRFRRLTDNNILDPEADLTIKITVDKEKNTFSMEDTGIGMSKDDLINRIGTVASSGTLEFLKNVKESNGNGKNHFDGELIGKFGVGFYSAFMVTDEITIETVPADPGSKGLKWISKGEDKFIIEESGKTNRGTKISFTFKEDSKEFSDPERIKSILKKYSNFIDFKIFVNDEEINKVKPLWQRKKEEISNEELNDFYKFISNDYQDPLGHLLFSIEGNINFKSLLFIPPTAPPSIFTELSNKTLQLYSSRVFIQDDCKELLPDYLRFLQGVVDTEDLSLNVSREVTQSSPLITKIRNVITGKILTLLEDWSSNDKEKFKQFFLTWGSLFKTGLNTDFTHKDRLVELVRYETSALEKGKMKSLKEYVASMPEDQKEIYYVMGDSRELIERNPNLEYFKQKGIEVIYLFDPVDVFTFPYITTYDNKSIKSIEKSDIDISSDIDNKDSIPEEKRKPLLQFIKEVVGDNVADVIESKRLVESPVTLVSGSQSLDPQMEKMMQYIDKDYVSSKKILEINTSHKLIVNLSKLYESNKESEMLKLTIMQLLDGALLLDGKLKTPSDYLQRMNEILIKATEMN